MKNKGENNETCIKDIDDVSPMTYPFDLELDDSYLREDDGMGPYGNRKHKGFLHIS